MESGVEVSLPSLVEYFFSVILIPIKEWTSVKYINTTHASWNFFSIINNFK